MYIINDGFSNPNSIDYNSKNSEKLEKEDIKENLEEINYQLDLSKSSSFC